MLWAEAGFRKVRGYRELGALAASLVLSPPSSLRSSFELKASEEKAGIKTK